jgi:hypothetical protein
MSLSVGCFSVGNLYYKFIPCYIAFHIKLFPHFVSEVLHDAKTRYPEAQKLLYIVLIASRKLCHYFQAHKISVVTSFPLRAMLCNLDATGTFAKRVAKLSKFMLNFVSRGAVKSQALADFIIKWTPQALSVMSSRLPPSWDPIREPEWFTL